MATSSFNKTFVVADKESCDYIREELSKERKTVLKPSDDYIKKCESGRKSLERILSL